jgi:hypothetical protein
MATSLDKRAAALKELQEIPGVGPTIARNLFAIGIHRIGQLKGRSPETLYRRLERHEGAPVDRCALYVMRCAVYYAENERRSPRLLKWWNWMDGAMKPGRRAKRQSRHP